MRFTLLILLTISFLELNAQRVGIGTTAPKDSLHIVGNVLISNNVETNKNYFNAYKGSLRIGLELNNGWHQDSMGIYSLGVGIGHLIKGNYSAAFGDKNKVHGYKSFAIGTSNTLSGSNSFVGGSYSVVNGTNSFAFGSSSLAEGNSSTAFGGGKALGNYSFVNGTSFAYNKGGVAFGSLIFQHGEYGFTSGTHLRSYAYLQHTIGRYNISNNNDNISDWIADEPLFVIGNGADNANRNNALTLLKNGNLGLNTTNPQALLHLEDGDAIINGLLTVEKDVILSEDIHVAGYLYGDGSWLSNLPDDDDWYTNSNTYFNLNKSFAIGSNSTTYKLYINGGSGQHIRTIPHSTSVVSTALKISMLDSGQGISSVAGIVGNEILIKNARDNINRYGVYTRVNGLNATTDSYGSYFSAEGTGDGDKYGVAGFATGNGQTKFGVYGIANGSGNGNYGVYGYATGATTNYAGFFSGDVRTTGETHTNELKVGFGSNNSTFQAMQGGTFIIGPDNGPNDMNSVEGFAEVQVTFPGTFPSIPKLIITTSAQNGTNWNDSFSITTKNITTTGATLNVYRHDQFAIWTQILEADWIGFSN